MDATEHADAIRVVGEALASRHAGLGRSIAERIVGDIPEYRSAGAEVVDDLEAGAAATAAVLSRTLATGRPLLREDVAFVRRLAARRVHTGIELEVFLHAYRAAFLAYWDACAEEVARLDVTRDATLSLARAALEAMDFITTQAAEAYLREDNQVRARSGRAERDLVERLLGGDTVEDRRRHPAAPGLDPAAALICAVARIEHSPLPADVALQHVQNALETALAAGRARPLMPIRHGEIVVLASGASSGARLPSLRAARTVVADEHAIDVRFGVSMPAAGFAGVRNAYREAVLALSHTTNARPIIPLDALSALESVLVGVSATARAVLAAQARELAALPGDDRAMILATVRALAASDLNVKRAAQQLHVHPNTVRYRQQRIAATTGHDPRTFAGLADLFCVVELLESETDNEPQPRGAKP
jgi:hypothetical protein